MMHAEFSRPKQQQQQQQQQQLSSSVEEKMRSPPGSPSVYSSTRDSADEVSPSPEQHRSPKRSNVLNSRIHKFEANKGGTATVPDEDHHTVYEGPLMDDPSIKPPTRRGSIREKLAKFEKKNKEFAGASNIVSYSPVRNNNKTNNNNNNDNNDHVERVRRKSSRSKRLLPRQDSDPTLRKNKAEYSPLGGRSTDPAPYATPAGYRYKIATKMSKHVPQAPTLDEDEHDDDGNDNNTNHSEKIETLAHPEESSDSIARPVKSKKKSHKLKQEQKQMEDVQHTKDHHRPGMFDSPTPRKSKKAWKPIVLSPPTRYNLPISTSEHSTSSRGSIDSAQEIIERTRQRIRRVRPQQKALSLPDEVSCMDRSNRQESNSDDAEERIFDMPLQTEPSEYPDTPRRTRSWKPKRVISIEEMKAKKSTSDLTSSDQANDGQSCQLSDDDQGSIELIPLKNDPSEYSDTPMRRKSWKPKRVISVEAMKARNSASSNESESTTNSQQGLVRSHSQGSELQHSWKPQDSSRVANDATKANDGERSPEPLTPRRGSESKRRRKPRVDKAEKVQVEGKVEKCDSIKAQDAESPPMSATKKTSKLQDRINMFNNFSSSPEPQRAFLSSRNMQNLVQKKEEMGETEGDHLAPVVESKLSIVDALSLATAEPTEGVSNGGSETSSQQGNVSDDGAMPRLSLDKSVAETKKKKVEKRRSMSIMKRGQLKATRSALVDQKDKDKNAVFANLLVREEDLPSHALPEFAKHPADKKIILTALRKNFVFEDLEDEDMEKMVAAMEEMKVSKGDEIMRQGADGDYFYVVSKGEVGFFVDGRKVATAGPGNAFGEISLLYTCPREKTVVAREQPTTLFRVDQKSFRFIMQSETKKSGEEKKKMLLQVPFLSSLGAEDIARLCSVMQPVVFYTGDYIVQKGETGSSFYMIQDGKVRVTEIFVGGTSYEDIVLGKGDYFGEDALVSEEPRAANVVALTTGRAFSIDRETVRKVLGDFTSLISKAQDRQKLESMKIFRDGDLDSADFDNLSKLITERKFSANETIFEQSSEVVGSLYIVREGAVKIEYSNRQEEVIGVGGAFGQEQLLADATGDAASDGKVLATSTATVIGDCKCGVLTLEDCRNTIDTSSLGDRIFSGGNSALEQQRAAMRALMRSKVKLEDLDKDRIIGEGQFGTVWLVRADPHKTNDKSKMLEFAMKVQFKEDEVRRDGAIEAIKREMTVIHQLNHPFIIDLVDKYETEDQLMMLTEPVKGGELWSRIHREEEDGKWTSGMAESDAKFYALVVADTVAYMHRQKIIFRDLKPENVLIDAEGYPTLCDFGFAKYCPDKTFTFCGTPNYLAPEIVLNRGHGAAVDHWALGVVTYEMITGENPFFYEGQDQMSLLQAIVQEAYYPLPEDSVSKEVANFMSAILEKDPVQRLGSLAGGEKGILKHDWFSDLDINEIRNKKAKAPFIPDI